MAQMDRMRCPFGCGWEGPPEEYPKHRTENHTIEIHTECVTRKPEDGKIPLCFSGLHDRIQNAFDKEDDVIDDYAELENMLRKDGFTEDADIVNEIRDDEVDHRGKFIVMLDKHSSPSSPASTSAMGLFERWLTDRSITLPDFKAMIQPRKDVLYNLFKAEERKEWSTPSHSSNPGVFNLNRFRNWRQKTEYTVLLDKGLPRELTLTVPAFHKAEASWLARKEFTRLQKVLPQTLEFLFPK